MTTTTSDQDVIEAIRLGRREAFQRVFDACYEPACRYAFSFVRHQHEAEDIVQSIFLKLWEKRESLQIQYSVKAYLFRAVYNHCMNQIEHRAVQARHQESAKYATGGEVQAPEVFPDELEEHIRRAIDALPPQCKTIFLMSRYEELRYPEIAQRLNISVNTIQNQICKALKILRTELKDEID